MTYKASWTVSGTKLTDSAEALENAVNSVTNTKNLKKYETELNKNFQNNIKVNLRRAGLNPNDFDDIFFLKISNGHISFIDTKPSITQKYEYGYDIRQYGENNTRTIKTTPRYFIRPAIKNSLNEIGNIMIREANNEYINNRRQTYGDDI